MKKSKFTLLLVVLISLIVLIHIIGIIIEILFEVGILETELVTIRSLHPLPLLLSFSFITSGIIFIILLNKQNKKVMRWWHIFMGINLLILIYKLYRPTYISLFIPYLVSFGLLVIIWFLIFLYLRKITSHPERKHHLAEQHTTVKEPVAHHPHHHAQTHKQ